MDLWYPKARTSRLGPIDKIGYPVEGNFTDKVGEIRHSMVGNFDDAMGVLYSPRRSSWTFSVRQNGDVYQHYAVTANTWHGNDTDMDGAVAANIDLVGVEYEGGPLGDTHQPLTEAQYLAGNDLTVWQATQFNRTQGYVRYPQPLLPGDWWLVEHNQVGDTGTLCPSGRIPWSRVLADLNTVIIPLAEAASMSLVWATWRNKPAAIPYRTYILMWTPTGPVKWWVPTYEQHVAIEESKIAGPLVELSLTTLLQYKGKPEPNEK